MAGKSHIQRCAPISAGQLHYYHTDFYYSMPELHKSRKMHGVKRVLVFCLMIVILPATLIIAPLYMRKTVFADVLYDVAESDIIEIRDGISSIFCSKHTLRMNTHFNAFQLRNRPEISTNRKHIRLKKSMTLPDDTLEYWGFFLLKGATVSLKLCSHYNNSNILVVKGKRELKLCGLTDHNKNKLGANYAPGHDQVKVFFEDVEEITEDKHLTDELQEHENHGGEDLTEDSPAVNVTHTPTKPIRKKLKKGSPHLYKSAEQPAELNAKASKYTNSSVKSSPHLYKSAEQPAEENYKASNDTKSSVKSSPHLYKSAEQAAEENAKASNDTKSLGLPSNRQRRHEQRKRQLYDELYKRRERKKRENVYDRKYLHGGNAVNFTETDESNSVSSFETGLFTCFAGTIYLTANFSAKPACMSAHFLETGKRDTVVHNISEDGYYYYIFYSDNDLVRNDIHAIFDIYKPTYQYSNLSESRGCLNSTECSFNIGFLSDEIVVVEVPTRDGIEHEDDDITELISTCHPRSEIYALFPITVLVLILCCSFL